MNQVYIDEHTGAIKEIKRDGERNTTVIMREPHIEAEPLTIEEYQHLAMRTLADEVRENTGAVLCKLSGGRAAMRLNAALGVASEAGEICEIYKKFFFHGHDWSPETEVHLKKETGDLFWYLALQCFANGWDPREILQMNIDKLAARYPEGFSAERSLHRAEGDI